jgi:WD40 repeat protein
MPHIYLSALPFAPGNSLVKQLYLPLYPKVLRLSTGMAHDWPAVVSVFEGHNGPVCSVAFSQDGKRIVSGSWDQTIRVWDAETGDIVVGPLEGHTDGVNSVASSQDGKRIVSGSRDHTIRVWDAETGDVIVGPL